MLTSSLRWAPFPCANIADLPEANGDEVGGHPGGKKAVDMCMMVKFRYFGGVSIPELAAELKFILILHWVCPRLKGKHVRDTNELWQPNISIINKESLFEMHHAPPSFDSDTGRVKQVVHCCGKIEHTMKSSHLRLFPFDYSVLRIFVAAEVETEDDSCRLRWETEEESSRPRSQDAVKSDAARMKSGERLWPASIVSPEVNAQSTEWHLVRAGTRVARRPRIPGATGKYTSFGIEVPITRKYSYYVWKVLLLVWMIAVMSWSVFVIKADDGRIDSESFVERLNLAATLLLAEISFLYVSQESIPRLSYLTALDKMILFSFFNIFSVMVQTVLIRLMSKMTDPMADRVQRDGEAGGVEQEDGHSGFLPQNYTYRYTRQDLADLDTAGLYVSIITFHAVWLLIYVVAMKPRWEMLNKRCVWDPAGGVLMKKARGTLDPGLSFKTAEKEEAKRHQDRERSGRRAMNNLMPWQRQRR